MRFLAIALFALLAACSPAKDGGESGQAPAIAPILTREDAEDPWTFARPEEARVSHVALDLDLDFARQLVAGTATLDVVADKGVDTLVLDGNGLAIAGVTDEAGNKLAFTVGEHVDGKGEPITIAIGDARKVVVAYSAKDAPALQWLAPEQTAGGKQPYLFSQGQPTLNRTWIPTQDSPGIRQSWEARITAPKELTVVMSALAQGEPEDAGEGKRAFRFKMDKPVAPYLIAIAAGDIVFRELGPRTGVWTEPAMIDAAASELADTEAMVEAAEKLYGPYRWGRYDVIVLPPSFPYGGMENPTMTFLTPTFIAGDKSLTGLVAHELAHSWSGNLVTNANWADSWLNEGVTSYFENRIVEQIYGPRRAAQEAALSFADMEEAIAENGSDSMVTALHLPPEQADPEGGSSGVIYDKGATFLRTVEKIVGREKFDAWLRNWFDGHAFQPATSGLFLEDMRANLVKGDEDLERQLMLDDWVYKPGLPANSWRPDPAAFAEVDAAATAYARDHAIDTAAWGKWSTAERLRFIAKLPRQLDKGQLGALDKALGLSQSGNNEILFAWLELALANRYQPAVPVAENFLSRIGRAKFVVPLYKEMMAQDGWGEPIARALYARTRGGYHAVTRGGVDAVVR
ncbi:MAG: M1 family metallopeptidase [Sphingomonadales bacterium]|nr:M1 family metallopeptidase [Sphingomonadales bacterium]MBD3775379.1 M1 family metallopeptidase [Paracoccaceae bacterium]